MRSGSPARRRLTPALLVMAMVAALLPLGQAATAATNTALQFNGSSQYIRTATTTSQAALQVTNFTVETWFRRTGTGAGINTNTRQVFGLFDSMFPFIPSAGLSLEF